MITNDERCAAARRLRNNAPRATERDLAWMVPWAAFNDGREHGARETMERLADLIEPNGIDVMGMGEIAELATAPGNNTTASGKIPPLSEKSDRGAGKRDRGGKGGSGR